MPLYKLALLTMIVLAIWRFPTISHASPPIEPDELLLVNEEINSVVGLYFREYSLKRNGTIDYKTARQIIVSAHNEYGNSVVHTEEYPLFYWYDSNQDGQMEMWVDQKVEGCPCDVILYEATSQEHQTLEAFGVKR